MIKVKAFKGYMKIDTEVSDDLEKILNDFSFYNGLFKKFLSLFQKLELNFENKYSNIHVSFKNTFWTLFILTHKNVMDKKSDIVDSVSLLGAIFFWALKNEEIVSNKINKLIQKDVSTNLNLKNNLILEEIKNFLNFKDMERFEHVLNDYVNYLQILQLEDILKENWIKLFKISVFQINN